MLRSSPVEVFSQKDALQTESKPTERKTIQGCGLNKATLQLY